jgi:O-antigen ligase
VKVNIIRGLSFFIDFFSVNGLYAITALVVAVNLNIESRYYTIPFRVIVTASIILIILLKRYRPCQDPVVYLLFIFFFAFYWYRIFLDMSIRDREFHIPPYEYLLYSIIYVIFPFIYYTQRRSDYDFERLFRALLISGLFFSVITIYIFFKSSVENGKFDRYLLGMDPLTISYVGALLVGICFSRLVFNTGYKNTKLLLAGLLIGICPFLIGGSRGPILALIIPLIIAFLSRITFSIKKKSIKYVILLIIALASALAIFGSIAFDRLNHIFVDLAAKSGDVRRLWIWETAFKQFLQSPVFGDSIQVQGVDYPHNLIIEVLMSTGIAGFIPFCLLMGFGIYKSFRILKLYPTYIWIYIFFFQALIMGMLSGNVYSNIWH